jgi:hypothetical protein
MADNLPPSSADVIESGNFNLPETSWPHRSVMELLYLFYALQLTLLLIRQKKMVEGKCRNDERTIEQGATKQKVEYDIKSQYKPLYMHNNKTTNTKVT